MTRVFSRRLYDAAVTWLWISLLVAGTLMFCTMLAAIAVWRSTSDADRAIVKRVSQLRWRDKLRLALRLVRDRRMPLAVRAIPPLVVLYLAMPLDVIPDFIPVAGQLDDLVVIALGVGLLVRFTPRAVLVEAVEQLEGAATRAAGSP